MQYYEVAPLKIVRASSGVFTYSSESTLAIGQLVSVPVGKQSLTGVVTKKVSKPPYETKPIEHAIDEVPIPIQIVETSLWMSAYYSTHLAIVLQTILPRGLTKKRRAGKTATTTVKRDRTNFVLNPEQRSAVVSIGASTPGTILLHGITGSGKTAVYIEVARQMLMSNRSVILLVPEISLTSQLVAEFQAHFSNVYLTHSRQTEAERHRVWQSVLNELEPVIVIGPRSALFMPLTSVGAIIIDEAHEPSFKQDKSPRYSALRVASVLGKLHHAKVIQGSATPLIAEYYLARQSDRAIIEMNTLARSDAVEPDITLVTMTDKTQFNRHRFFSDKLLDQIDKTLERGKQVLVFHNRRGSASTTLCEQCGWSALCPRCFVPFTLHTDAHQLRCHICGITQRVPTSCPVCHSTDIVHKGIGTKLIESELRRLYPKKTIARFDGDTTDDATIDQKYQEVYDGSIDIIIGTQVVAKGLDLPHLRCVGVIQADAGLSLPDFAASERTFQLLAQVVGRVGRSNHESHVVVQSYQPDALAVRAGLKQDYNAFYQETLAERKRSKFPPFTYLLRLVCVYKTEAAAVRNAQQLASQLRHTFLDVVVFGPTPAFYEHQHNTYRWQIVVKSPRRARLLEIVDTLPPAHWQYDLDPASLL